MPVKVRVPVGRVSDAYLGQARSDREFFERELRTPPAHHLRRWALAALTLALGAYAVLLLAFSPGSLFALGPSGLITLAASYLILSERARDARRR